MQTNYRSMETLPVISLVVIGLAAIAVKAKERDAFLNPILLLLFAAISVIVSSYGTEESNIIYGLIGVLAVNLAVARMSAMRKPIIRAAIPVATFGLFLSLFASKTFLYFDYEISIQSLPVIVLILVGTLALEISVLVSEIFKKIDPKLDVQQPLLLAILGFLCFFGLFKASAFGVLLAGAGFLASSFYHEAKHQRLVYPLLIASTMPMLISLTDLESVNLLEGKVLEGIFVGAFGLVFIQAVWKVSKWKSVFVTLAYGLTIGASLGLLFAATQFGGLGGMDAYIGILVGLGVATALVGEGVTPASLFPLLLAGGMILPSFMKNEEVEEIQEIITEVKNDETGEVVGPTVLPMNEIAGSYKVEEESAIITFELGKPGSLTKGAIKQFTGNVTIGEDVTQSSFNVELRTENLTTFNGMRDKSVRGSGYLKAAEFPTMKFKTKSVKLAEAENEFLVEGEFEMLGVKKSQFITVKRIEEGTNKVVIGSGSLNRTDFGMKSAPSEGNEISFEFKMILK